jgi:hypothetical protein
MTSTMIYARSRVADNILIPISSLDILPMLTGLEGAASDIKMLVQGYEECPVS